jgi:hypothetical protein
VGHFPPFLENLFCGHYKKYKYKGGKYKKLAADQLGKIFRFKRFRRGTSFCKLKFE